MVEKKKQTIRYTDGELEIIKATFADNEELLKAIRKHFLQIPLDPIDQDIIKQVKGGVLKVLRKSFLPEIDGNAPFHQVIDLWMTLEIKDKRPEEVAYLAEAREKLIDYLDQQLSLLEETIKKPKIMFHKLVEKKDKTAIELYTDLTVRNTVIAHTEMQINQLFVLAGRKEETTEQTKERLLKDSMK